MFWYIVALLGVLLYVYYKRTFSYWSSRNVPGPRAWPFVGSLPSLLLDESRRSDYRLYRKYGKMYGEYLGHQTCLTISDVALAKQIMVADFHVFSQAQKMPFKVELFTKMLTVLFGPDWKRVRAAVSPTFSTAKLRRALEHLHTPMQNFIANTDELIRLGKADQVQLKELSKGYALDVIAKFVFAVEVNSFRQKDDLFVRNVIKMTTFKSWVMGLTMLLPPVFFDKLALSVVDLSAARYFADMSQEILRQRRANPELKYKDFLDLLLENGSELSDEEMITQCLVFFFAGMDTVSTASSILLSDLAIHPDVQQKLLEEIQEKLGDAPITYDNINELDYLEAVFMESMRMTPIANRLMRHPQEDYRLPGSDLVLEKGRTVMIGVYNIHHDERIYPAPFEFRPERFLGEAKKELQSQAWFGFGGGPRNCVAVRFATLEVKFFVINLVRRYQLSMAKGSPVPVQYEKGSFLVVAKDLRLQFEMRE